MIDTKQSTRNNRRQTHSNSDMFKQCKHVNIKQQRQKHTNTKLYYNR